MEEVELSASAISALPFSLVFLLLLVSAFVRVFPHTKTWSEWGRLVLGIVAVCAIGLVVLTVLPL